MAKIIQSGQFLDKTLSNVTDKVGKKALIDLAVPFPKDVFSELVTNGNMTLLHKFYKKLSARRTVRAGEAFTLSISNEDIDDIIKIVESLEKFCLLIYGITETLKHETKKEGEFLGAIMAPMAALLIATMMKTISGTVVVSARKGQEGGFLSLLALAIVMKATFGRKGI